MGRYRPWENHVMVGNSLFRARAAQMAMEMGYMDIVGSLMQCGEAGKETQLTLEGVKSGDPAHSGELCILYSQPSVSEVPPY